MNIKTIAPSAAQLFLGATFTKAGTDKLRRTDEMREEFARFGYPSWFMRLTGTVETAAGASMLAGLAWPRAARVGGTLLIPTMAGALWTHLAKMGDPPKKAAPAFVMLGLTAGVLAAHASR